MSGGSGRRVLVVGSDQRADRLVESLSATGLKPLQAPSVPVGVATLEERAVDCLVVTGAVDDPADAFAVARRRGNDVAGVYVGEAVASLPAGVETTSYDDAAATVRRRLLTTAVDDAEPVDGPDPLAAYGATVAHELRNHIEVATLALESDQPDRVEAALERLEDLAREAEAVAGGTVAETAAVPVADAVDDAAERLRTPMLTVETPVDRTVEADRSLLTLLFENCFRNAVEHAATPDGGDAAENHAGTTAEDADDVADLFDVSNGDQTTVESEGRSATVTVESTPDGFAVVDDGPGFETDRPFAWGETTGDGRGTGLAVVERIAAAHGWTVAASNDDGARIDVRL
ncbi:MAG: sensor histidine kinase [Halolamina sp.]